MHQQVLDGAIHKMLYRKSFTRRASMPARLLAHILFEETGTRTSLGDSSGSWDRRVTRFSSGETALVEKGDLTPYFVSGK